MKKQKRALPRLVVFGIMTLITTIAWVGFEIYRAFTKSPDPIVPPEVIAPLDPTLDTFTLESLVNKVYLEDEEIGPTILLNRDREVVIQELEESEEEIATESGQT